MMIQNAAFPAMLTVFLIVGWFAGEVRFLAPFKTHLFRVHGLHIVVGILVLFLNLCAAYYSLGRWLLLRDTGRKLSHLDRQLTARDASLDAFDPSVDPGGPDVA